MSIESAQQASTDSSTPRTATGSAKATATPVAVPLALQQPTQPLAMSTVTQMNDVLLNDEMSMMGCDVTDAWTNARPHFHMAPTHHVQQQQQQQQQQANAFFTCPPATLTRHMSLPIAILHNGTIQYGTSTPVHHHPQQHQPQQLVVPASAMPPALARHHSHSYVLTPTHHQPPLPHHYRPVVAHMQPMFELNVSHQQQQFHPQQQQQQRSMRSKSDASFSSATALNVEPLPFTPSSASSSAKQQLHLLDDDEDDGAADSFANDLEPLAFSVFETSEQRPKNFQQLESAIESLDRLLPAIERDLFHHHHHQQQQQQAAFVMHHPQQHATLVTPRNVVYGRAALPLLLSPHGKELATSPAAASAMALSGMLIHNTDNYAPACGFTPKSARHLATCKVADCDRRVRSKGFCKTHGGGRKCNIDGCKKSSQNGEFCIGHGGGKKCKEDGCAKAAQSHGLCKAHGGGARCKFVDCNKSSQGGGLCRAHGGGKRCQAAGCPKGAQRGNFCATHGGFRNCAIDNCVRTDRGGGFCEVHRRGRLCKVDGCKKLSRNQGMCTMHIREDKQEDASIKHDDNDIDYDVTTVVASDAAGIAA